MSTSACGILIVLTSGNVESIVLQVVGASHHSVLAHKSRRLSRGVDCVAFFVAFF